MGAEIRLQAGALSAVFLPGQGMLGASLRHRGHEVLGLVGDIAAMASQGRTCGIPLLYPWANRLAVPRYEAAGRRVELQSPLLSRDDAGLLNHGVPWPHLAWSTLSEGESTVRAELPWASEQLLSVFPYRHRVVMDVDLDRSGLTITTEVHADAGQDVPISFGFHPFFVLPGVPREEWRVEIPAMTALLTDDRMIPTGQSTNAAAISGTLGGRTFDDGFALHDPGAVFELSGGSRAITIRFGEGYTHAQLFAPPGLDFMAVEPMTAPVNALVTGEGLRVAAAGSVFSARFRIEVA